MARTRAQSAAKREGKTLSQYIRDLIEKDLS